MAWWLWTMLGCVLLIGEILTPGVFLLFFGCSALAVGFLVSLNIAGPLEVQLALFSGIAILLLLTLRKKILTTQSKVADEVDSIVGQLALATSNMSLEQSGKVELRGTSWNAKNVSSKPISVGEQCRIEKVDGLVLHIVKID